MGLLSYLLHRANRHVGLGYSLARLAVRCWNVGWQHPLLIVEKVGVFWLDRKSGKLGLAYFVVRVVLTREHNTHQVHTTLRVIGNPEQLEELGATPGEVSTAVKLAEALQDKRARELAGCMFCEHMLNRRAVSSQISARYAMPRGCFDMAGCLKDFYSSPRSLAFCDEIRSTQQEGFYREERLEILVDKLWHEITHRTTHELIDLFLL